MTKDELIYKLRYFPGDIRILIFCKNDIAKGFHEMDDHVGYYCKMIHDDIPAIVLKIKS